MNKSAAFAALLSSLFSPAAQKEITRTISRREAAVPNFNNFPHRSGEGPRETARRRRQMEARKNG